MPIRKPHVAGYFYPSSAEEIREFCQVHLRPAAQTPLARAVILPHAGYIYSGKTACHVLAQSDFASKIVLIGPNHRGVGADFAIFSSGAWETPLGSVSIDENLAQTLLKSSHDLRDDVYAHATEHSLEVLIPLLQYRKIHFSMVPIIIGTLDLDAAEEVAMLIGESLGNNKDPLTIVISNDMSHYDSDQNTRYKDQYALDAIKNMDAKALAKAVQKYDITMCGFVPVYMLLSMKNLLGIKKVRLVEYTTSAEASGDYNKVVGYAGFIFE